jgi:hypothetical protein
VARDDGSRNDGSRNTVAVTPRLLAVSATLGLVVLSGAGCRRAPLTRQNPNVGLFWVTATIKTGRDQIEVNGQVIAVVREPFLNGRYLRPKFRCPACAQTCRVLHLKDR